jgi:hypothetical protein
MNEQLVSFKTAKLAKEKGFNENCLAIFASNGELHQCDLTDLDDIYNMHYPTSNTFINRATNKDWIFINGVTAPTQTQLQKYIRENRGVHIEIHRNASGYYWSMCKSDGGTDLGWSDDRGPNDGGVWDSFEDALENALFVQLSYDLPEDMSIIGHWGNYAIFALKSITH